MRVLLSVEWVRAQFLIELPPITTQALRETGNRTEMALDGKAYLWLRHLRVFAIQRWKISL